MTSDDLSFLTDEALRAMIARDILEMKSCLENKNPKATMILAGSIIEAILVDYFLAFPPPNGKTHDQITRANLEQLIEWAADKDVRLISEDTKGISTVIRNFRNLIHPGKAHRLSLQVDMPKAAVSANLVEIIIGEIRANYIVRLGYTADQALKKLSSDVDQGSAFFEHLLNRMSEIERIKLYRAIPKLDYIYVASFPNFDEKVPFDLDASMAMRFRYYLDILRTHVPIETRRT